MAEYVCKDPSCSESVAWHLIHGDLDCIGDNREAVAEWASDAQSVMDAFQLAISALKVDPQPEPVPGPIPVPVPEPVPVLTPPMEM
jgi:hypothetical protein